MTTLEGQVREAEAFLRAALPEQVPAVGMVLGSGITANELPLEERVEIPAEEIPHLPRPKVEGHGGSWISGSLDGIRVLVAGGRTHRYEGVPLAQATLGVRLMQAVGCHSLVVTNAAGGINPDFTPGTLMRLRDHINMQGDSPLVGDHHADLGARFVDMTEAYDAEWGRRVVAAMKEQGIEVAEGVYAACLGPQYETPSEVRMLGMLGADAVGMSTVPEVIVARQVGLRVFGLSLISNAAAGISPTPLSHDEVLQAGREARPRLSVLLAEAVRQAGRH